MEGGFSRGKQEDSIRRLLARVSVLREAESEAESRRAEGGQCGMEVPKVGRGTTEGPVAGWQAKPPANPPAPLRFRNDVYLRAKQRFTSQKLCFVCERIWY